VIDVELWPFIAVFLAVAILAGALFGYFRE